MKILANLNSKCVVFLIEKKRIFAPVNLAGILTRFNFGCFKNLRSIKKERSNY